MCVKRILWIFSFNCFNTLFKTFIVSLIFADKKTKAKKLSDLFKVNATINYRSGTGPDIHLFAKSMVTSFKLDFLKYCYGIHSTFHEGLVETLC